ncbi:MAG: 3'(2'),5'-bisphosphate nucleotidase CysQ [Rickettsiales bacterium]
MNDTYKKYIENACEIAREAGQIIMGYVGDGFSTMSKADSSPVTEADIAANDYIIKKLSENISDIPLITEEDESSRDHNHDIFFLIDPLDGTKSFVRGEDEFTVNIALIENKMLVFGVIYCPAQRVLYYGMDGYGSYKQIGENSPMEIKTREVPAEGVTVVRSRSSFSEKTTAYLDTLNVHEIIKSSSSVKLCLIAEGKADIYPRFGRTMEWDIAAGHAILKAAGGDIKTASGSEFLYGKKGFENPEFIAFGKIK